MPDSNRIQPNYRAMLGSGQQVQTHLDADLSSTTAEMADLSVADRTGQIALHRAYQGGATKENEWIDFAVEDPEP